MKKESETERHRQTETETERGTSASKASHSRVAIRVQNVVHDDGKRHHLHRNPSRSRLLRLLLLLPCLFPRTKKTSSDYAEQERHTECVESSSTTNFSLGTWSSFSSSQGLELGLGESWHQTSKADSDSAQLEGDW